MASLTIAFVPGVSPAKWARVWRERMPAVELVLRAIGPDDVAAALDGDVDMCFARLPVDPALAAIPLWTETPVVAMPKDADLAALDTVTTEDLADVQVLGEGPVPEDVDATLDLVEANVGVAVLPQSLFRAASRKALVGRPLTDVPGTRVALVWREADASDVTDEFIGVVRGRTANSSRGRTEDADPAPPRSTPARSGGTTGARSGDRRPGGSGRGAPRRSGPARGGKRRGR